MKKPFFAKYLEAQSKDEGEKDEKGLRIKTSVKSGATLKYPSDRDEFVTLKYPSDDDEYVNRR